MGHAWPAMATELQEFLHRRGRSLWSEVCSYLQRRDNHSEPLSLESQRDVFGVLAASREFQMRYRLPGQPFLVKVCERALTASPCREILDALAIPSGQDARDEVLSVEDVARDACA